MNLNLFDSSSGDISSLGERLLQFENNPIDFLSLINNSVGQSNKSPANPHFSVSSKYVSDLDRVSKRDGSFSVLQLNVQGLCSSFDELKKIVRSGHPDFIGLCETFLDSKNESLLHLSGYKMGCLNQSRMALLFMFRNVFRTLLDVTCQEMKKEFLNPYLLRLKPKLKL